MRIGDDGLLIGIASSQIGFAGLQIGIVDLLIGIAEGWIADVELKTGKC